MPKVLNKHRDAVPPGAVYVGRPTKWGNPFVIGKDGTREEVIAKYRKMVCDLQPLQAYHFMREVADELKGRDLVCFCAPLPCHADVLLELAESIPEGWGQEASA